MTDEPVVKDTGVPPDGKPSDPNDPEPPKKKRGRPKSKPDGPPKPQLQDLPGYATFPQHSQFGHFVFKRPGFDISRQFIVVADIQRCKFHVHPKMWKPKWTQPNKKTKHPFTNRQIQFEIDELPSVLSALAELYKQESGKEPPIEARPIVKQEAKAVVDKETEAFMKKHGGEF